MCECPHTSTPEFIMCVSILLLGTWCLISELRTYLKERKQGYREPNH